jgi:Uma2 family endonuclease
LPLPEDIHLVIEVADTTLARDRDFKLALYARDGIREYWIVNLEQNRLEAYRDPDGDRYATSFTVRDGKATPCLDFPDDPIDWS